MTEIMSSENRCSTGMPRFPSPQQMLALGSIPASYNGHAADAAAGDTTIVLGQTDRGVLQLSRPCLPPKLEVRLKDHPQPAGSDRVTEALQAAISIDRYFTSQVEAAKGVRKPHKKRCLPSIPPCRQLQLALTRITADTADCQLRLPV